MRESCGVCSRRVARLAFLVGLLCAGFAAAQDDGEEPFVLPPTVVEGVQPAFNPVIGGGAIFGDSSSVFDAPGSGFYLDADEILSQSYGDVNRVLRKVPGVYLRDEDGFGNFPNISLRGVDTTRSAKVTIMEDGILAAPAPYAAPAAYYFPNVNRMSAVEVVKGHSQIRFGPHITGGAINFLSTQIPAEETIYLRTLFGTNNEYRVHTWIGDTMETKIGRVGYVLEGYLRETDGFKTIDAGPDFRDTGDTGFSRREPMLKVFWEPNTITYQRWEAKVGYTSFDANETYLGLSEADFAADPFRRYTASRFDNIASTHTRAYLRYTIGDPECDWVSLTNTVYYNKFHRNWYKLNDLRNIDTNGDGVGDGVNMDLSAALAGDGGGVGLDVLRGDRAGTWRLRANNRDYYSYGYDAVATSIVETQAATHTLSAGFRYHADQIHPFQHNDEYEVDDTGNVTTYTPGAPGSQRNRDQEVHAIALYAMDEIDFGRLKVAPGIRFEHLNMSTQDFNAGTPQLKGDLDMTGGGIGMTYDLTDEILLLAGFHQGFSPPSPRGRLISGLNEEKASAAEFGARYMNRDRALSAQMIYFYTHFQDLIVVDNVGGAGVGAGVDENVGEVESQGLEFYVEYDLGIERGWCCSNPYFFSMTYTDASLLNDSTSTDPESIFAGGRAGNRLPYIPEYSATLGTGLHFDLFGAEIRGSYVGEQFTSASNTTMQVNAAGDPDARFGVTDEYFIWDLSVYAYLAENWKVFGGLQNIFDESYIVNRHPHGPRPGAPQFGYVGLEAIY